MIGDKPLDCLAGGNFGVKPILLGTGYGKEELEKAKKEGKQDFSYFPTFLLNRASSSSVSLGQSSSKESGRRAASFNSKNCSSVSLLFLSRLYFFIAIEIRSPFLLCCNSCRYSTIYGISKSINNHKNLTCKSDSDIPVFASTMNFVKVF